MGTNLESELRDSTTPSPDGAVEHSWLGYRARSHGRVAGAKAARANGDPSAVESAAGPAAGTGAVWTDGAGQLRLSEAQRRRRAEAKDSERWLSYASGRHPASR